MKDEILNKVRQAGIVGAGGAGFPTAIKLAASPEYIVVNGAECEPLLQVDQQLAQVFAADLLRTLDRLTEALGAKEGIFALKAKYKGAVAALEKEIKAWPRLKLKTLGNFYPMGDEQVLVYETLGRIVPEGGIPIACGVVVVNVETLLNIGHALDSEEPVTEKYVTVTGAVAKPATFKVPVGLTVAELLRAAGGPTVPQPVFINGGPMMGRAETDFQMPITKTSKGLIVLNSDHRQVLAKQRPLEQMMRLARTACCHCMLCTDLCPRYMLGHSLHPDKLMRLASYNSTAEKDASATEAFLCCECGLCEIACIMELQPWKLNKALKQKLGSAGLKNPHHNQPEAANPFRPYRQYPIPKLIRRLGLAAYEHQNAPLTPYPESIGAVRLMLKQHLGPPAEALVKAGETVEKGQPVAAPAEGAMGAIIHASRSGRVTRVDSDSIVIDE